MGNTGQLGTIQEYQSPVDRAKLPMLHNCELLGIEGWQAKVENSAKIDSVLLRKAYALLLAHYYPERSSLEAVPEKNTAQPTQLLGTSQCLHRNGSFQ